MKAGANYLYVPPTTKGSSQEHHDEISAYLSRHHSQKTNTPICLWHTKAVINMAHWSEYMYSRSIQCQLPPRWREEKMMFIMHQCGLEGMLFYQSEEQIVKMPVKAAEKKQKACFIQWATVTLDILTWLKRLKRADLRKYHVTVCRHMPLSESSLITCFRFLSLYIICICIVTA